MMSKPRSSKQREGGAVALLLAAALPLLLGCPGPRGVLQLRLGAEAARGVPLLLAPLPSSTLQWCASSGCTGSSDLTTSRWMEDHTCGAAHPSAHSCLAMVGPLQATLLQPSPGGSTRPDQPAAAGRN